jgi:ABC-type sugar transport system ATPase subunit
MQVGTPQELYDTPNNVFVAGFIGSPAMNDAYIYGTTDVGEKVDIDDPDLRGEDKATKLGDNIIARTDGRRPPTRGETVHLVPSDRTTCTSSTW